MTKNYQPLKDHIKLVNERNTAAEELPILGVSINKCFIKSVANVIGTDLTTYKVVKRGQFVCILMRVSRDDKVPVDCLRDYDKAIVSPAYAVFEVVDESKLLPAYLALWFKRPEFDREASFYAVGGVRGSMEWSDFTDMKLPVPSLDKQRAIIEAYEIIQRRIELKRKINDNLEAATRSVFKRYFVEHGIGDTYASGTFSSLLATEIGGDWGNDTPLGNQNTEIRCIRGTDIPDLNRGTVSAPVRFVLAKNAKEKRLMANDLVIEISGGSPTQSTGRIAFVHSECLSKQAVPLLCSNFCRVLRIKPDYALYAYCYWQFLYRNGRLFCYENSSTGLKNLDLSGFISEEPIPVPPIEVIKEFNGEIELLRCEMLRNQGEIDNLTATKTLLLPQLMANS